HFCSLGLETMASLSLALCGASAAPGDSLEGQLEGSWRIDASCRRGCGARIRGIPVLHFPLLSLGAWGVDAERRGGCCAADSPRCCCRRGTGPNSAPLATRREPGATGRELSVPSVAPEFPSGTAAKQAGRQSDGGPLEGGCGG
ncbi:unnamed protein product, partial [Symbiodinium sp. CCMP2592]